MNAHVRAQFLGILLSGFYFRIFHFSPYSSKRCKISLFQFYRNNVQTLPYEKIGITPWVECTHHKAVSQNISPVFFCRYLLFHCTHECAPECPFANPSMMQFQNSVIERKFYLWQMIRHIYHKRVSQKVSFLFLCEDISFYTAVIYILPKVPW